MTGRQEDIAVRNLRIYLRQLRVGYTGYVAAQWLRAHQTRRGAYPRALNRWISKRLRTCGQPRFMEVRTVGTPPQFASPYGARS